MGSTHSTYARVEMAGGRMFVCTSELRHCEESEGKEHSPGTQRIQPRTRRLLSSGHNSHKYNSQQRRTPYLSNVELEAERELAIALLFVLSVIDNTDGVAAGALRPTLLDRW